MIMLTRKLSRLFSNKYLISFIRHQANVAQNRDQHLSNVTVTSFYCQNDVEQLALKVFLFH